MTENPLRRGKTQGSGKFLVTPPPPEAAEERDLTAVPEPAAPEPAVEPVRDDSAADVPSEPAPEETPEPAPQSEAKSAPKKKRAAKTQPRPARSTGGAPPAAPAGATPRLPEIDYTQDPSEPRLKDWGMLPQTLMQAIEMARMQWTVANADWLKEHGAPAHISGFKEALMRLGLKHINDPEFADLIPPDRRRGKVRRELDTFDD